MPDFKQTEESFSQLESGLPRLSGIRKAIQEADACKDLYWQFYFRFDYLKESIFCGDRYYAMIIFPELLSLFDQNSSLQENKKCSFDVLVAFKWIVEAAPEFPQISKAEIDGYFHLFKKRLLREGYSLSIYYMKHQLFYMHCDPGIAAADFYRFLDQPLDILSDGKALYHDQQAMYYLSIGEEEKALKAAEPIFAGKMRSNALPQSTYHDFLRFYLEHGRFKEAMQYADLTERRVNRDAYYLDIIGSMMTLYSITDRGRGAQLFSQNYPIYQESKNPMLRMKFEMGAYALLSALAEGEETVFVPKTSPLYSLVQKKDYAAAAEWFERTAAQGAGKFDARNGTRDFTEMLYYMYQNKGGDEIV